MTTPGTSGSVLFVLCVCLFAIFSDQILVGSTKMQVAMIPRCVVHDHDSLILLSYGQCVGDASLTCIESLFSMAVHVGMHN